MYLIHALMQISGRKPILAAAAFPAGDALQYALPLYCPWGLSAVYFVHMITREPFFHFLEQPYLLRVARRA